MTPESMAVVSEGDFTAEPGMTIRTPSLMEQKVVVEGVEGLRMFLDILFSTWRQGGDFTIEFTEGGKQGPTVRFKRPEGHRDYAAEILAVHRGDT